ncbi:hypothetical protein ACFYM5_30555 [Streptomyces sp. NPDC006706]|uniref:hypothetical protein n=1 Tax=Streptomyces sp. NPDC006706 TaxID=3364761 RepID=UPI0036BA653B
MAARAGRVPWKHPGDVPPGAGPAAVTLGRFDGVHRGHRRLPAAMRRPADTLGVAAGAVAFARRPLGPLAPDRLPTTPGVPFTGPFDSRRPGGHRCPRPQAPGTPARRTPGTGRSTTCSATSTCRRTPTTARTPSERWPTSPSPGRPSPPGRT